MRRFRPFLVALFIIAVLLRVDLFFNILYLFLALALMSHFWMRHRVERLRVERRFVDRAFFGEQIAVDLMVQNTSWLPIPWLEVHDSLPVQLVVNLFQREAISLGPYERRNFHYTLNCRQRGYYQIGPLTMEGGDLLGLERTSARWIAPSALIVYPQVLPLQQLGLPIRSPQVVLPAQAPLFEDPARIIGVRDYQRGDSPRRIHWTATASAGRLLVKQYQPAIAHETLICLDLDRDDYKGWYTATELAIVVAASVANHIIIQEGLPVGLTTEATDPLLDKRVRFFLPPRSERAHLMSLLEILARAQAGEGTSFADLVRRESVRLTWGATVLVITGGENVALLDTLAYLRRAGFSVALVLVQHERLSDDLQRRADLFNLSVHQVWRERDLETWR